MVEGGRAGPAVASDRLDPGRVGGVADDLVTAANQAARHVGAHPAQPYHPELHAALLLIGDLLRCAPRPAGPQPRDGLQRAPPLYARLDGPAQQRQARFHAASEMHAQRPAPALAKNSKITESLSRLLDTEGSSPARHRQVVRVVARDEHEHAGVRPALVGLPG